MSASLVGSEMCIRDRLLRGCASPLPAALLGLIAGLACCFDLNCAAVTTVRASQCRRKLAFCFDLDRATVTTARALQCRR
eukprot:11181011-Alexandrium_andersonii.AAC.1